jgi:hypothetical protein
MTILEPLMKLQRAPVLMLLEADAPAAAEAAAAWADAGLTVRALRGAKMRSTNALMDESSAALQLPHYFGENWPALDECLSDMDWLLPTTGIVVLVRDAADVLVDEGREELEAFVNALRNASRGYAEPVEQGEWWDRPAVPFHVVLQTASAASREATRRWEAAGAETTPLLA